MIQTMEFVFWTAKVLLPSILMKKAVIGIFQRTNVDHHLLPPVIVEVWHGAKVAQDF